MTLLELLIAMAVFAILSMMAYGGLKAAPDAAQAHDRTEKPGRA